MWRPAIADRPDEALDEHRRLAGTCAGRDEDEPARVDRRELLLVRAASRRPRHARHPAHRPEVAPGRAGKPPFGSCRTSPGADALDERRARSFARSVCAQNAVLVEVVARREARARRPLASARRRPAGLPLAGERAVEPAERLDARGGPAGPACRAGSAAAARTRSSPPSARLSRLVVLDDPARAERVGVDPVDLPGEREAVDLEPALELGRRAFGAERDLEPPRDEGERATRPRRAGSARGRATGLCSSSRRWRSSSSSQTPRRSPRRGTRAGSERVVEPLRRRARRCRVASEARRRTCRASGGRPSRGARVDLAVDVCGSSTRSTNQIGEQSAKPSSSVTVNVVRAPSCSSRPGRVSRVGRGERAAGPLQPALPAVRARERRGARRSVGRRAAPLRARSRSRSVGASSSGQVSAASGRRVRPAGNVVGARARAPRPRTARLARRRPRRSPPRGRGRGAATPGCTPCRRSSGRGTTGSGARAAAGRSSIARRSSSAMKGDGPRAARQAALLEAEQEHDFGSPRARPEQVE